MDIKNNPKIDTITLANRIYETCKSMGIENISIRKLPNFFYK